MFEKLLSSGNSYGIRAITQIQDQIFSKESDFGLARIKSETSLNSNIFKNVNFIKILKFGDILSSAVTCFCRSIASPNS